MAMAADDAWAMALALANANAEPLAALAKMEGACRTGREWLLEAVGADALLWGDSMPAMYFNLAFVLATVFAVTMASAWARAGAVAALAFGGPSLLQLGAQLGMYAVEICAGRPTAFVFACSSTAFFMEKWQQRSQLQRRVETPRAKHEATGDDASSTALLEQRAVSAERAQMELHKRVSELEQSLRTVRSVASDEAARLVADAIAKAKESERTAVNNQQGNMAAKQTEMEEKMLTRIKQEAAERVVAADDRARKYLARAAELEELVNRLIHDDGVQSAQVQTAGSPATKTLTEWWAAAQQSPSSGMPSPPRGHDDAHTPPTARQGTVVQRSSRSPRLARPMSTLLDVESDAAWASPEAIDRHQQTSHRAAYKLATNQIYT